MKIRITNIRDSLSQPDRSDLTFAQSEQVVGDLEIEFNSGSGEPEVFKRADMNLPLFVAETKLFLERTKAHGHASWKMYFAPFVEGRMEGGDLLIVRGTRIGESKTIDRLTPDGLSDIESLLSSLTARYGCLRPLPEAKLQNS